MTASLHTALLKSLSADLLLEMEEKLAKARQMLLLDQRMADASTIACEAYVFVACRYVLDFCCEQWGVRRLSVLGRGRVKHVAECRQVAMYFCRDPRISGIALSAKEVAPFFERNYSDIIHARRVVTIRRSIKSNAPEEVFFRRRMDHYENYLREKTANRPLAILTGDESQSNKVIEMPFEERKVLNL